MSEVDALVASLMMVWSGRSGKSGLYLLALSNLSSQIKKMSILNLKLDLEEPLSEAPNFQFNDPHRLFLVCTSTQARYLTSLPS